MAITRRSFLKSIFAGVAAVALPAAASEKFGEESTHFDGYVAGDTEFKGFIDEVRVSKGSVIPTSEDFTIEGWILPSGESKWVHYSTVRDGEMVLHYTDGVLVKSETYKESVVTNQWHMISFDRSKWDTPHYLKDFQKAT